MGVGHKMAVREDGVPIWLAAAWKICVIRLRQVAGEWMSVCFLLATVLFASGKKSNPVLNFSCPAQALDLSDQRGLEIKWP